MIKLMNPTVGEEELQLIREVIESGNLVEGRMVNAFEDYVCNWVGVNHAVACNSATTGLELALRALNVGQGDEVIIPGFTHPATALSVMAVGAKPVIVDVDVDSYNVTSELIKDKITKRTKAIIPVSLFGNPLDINPIIDLGLPVIEDAACSLGSEKDGRMVGSQATISVFSFHPRKIFATGDGGLVVTNNREYAERMRRIKKFGGFKEWGTNYRMSDILGAVALGQVRKGKKIIENRRIKAAIYNTMIHKTPQNSNWQSYAVPIKNRDEKLKFMKDNGVECQVGTYALHTLEIFNQRVQPVSQFLHDSLITLPLHDLLTLEEQKHIIRLLYE